MLPAYSKTTAKVSLVRCEDDCSLTHQSNYGTLSRELSGTEECSDESVDLFLLRVMLVVVWRHLRFLWESQQDLAGKKTIETIEFVTIILDSMESIMVRIGLYW